MSVRWRWRRSSTARRYRLRGFTRRSDKADIVISSTGAPHAIFRKEHGERFLKARRNEPMFFIDIAVPRDVDPALNELDGIFRL